MGAGLRDWMCGRSQGSPRALQGSCTDRQRLRNDRSRTLDLPFKSRQGEFLPVLAFFGVKTVALQGLLTLPQQRLHYSPRLLPILSTYKLNGSSLGRPYVHLIFAKWAFNIVRLNCVLNFEGAVILAWHWSMVCMDAAWLHTTHSTSNHGSHSSLLSARSALHTLAVEAAVGASPSASSAPSA